MRLVIGAVLLIVPVSPALAGGLGVLATGGMHTEQVHFYSDHSPDGDEYSNVSDYDQYSLIQTLPSLGGGLELILGDRDDRIMGSVRALYINDGSQTNPAELTGEVDPDFVVGAFREKDRHLGFVMVGLSWGIIGDPGGLQLAAVGHVGSAFLTLDHTEFLAFQAGPGLTYQASRQIQLFGDAQYQGRFRKGLTHSFMASAGARYLFD